MTNLENAERLRKAYLQSTNTKHNVKNICRAIPNWNGCDYCDVYAGSGIECWKQGSKHNCCHCERVNINENNI